MRIEEVTSLQHAQRVASHSHIKGLGLLPDGSAKDTHMGMVRNPQAKDCASQRRLARKAPALPRRTHRMQILMHWT